MKLATIRRDSRENNTVAVRIDGDSATDLGFPSVDALLKAGALDAARTLEGPQFPTEHLDFAPVVTNPGKIICVGVNYRPHIKEMGREIASHPTLFMKFSEALVGSGDPLIKPFESEMFDFEGELGVVIGQKVRRAKGPAATAAIAGFTICMDGSVRDWQNHTGQWVAGKAWEGSTPVGPVLVDRDSFERHARLTTRLDGEVMQNGFVDDVVFGPEAIIEYVSTFVTLNPGDLILTGTPGGVGHARKPPVYLQSGQTLEIEIDGIGVLSNVVTEG